MKLIATKSFSYNTRRLQAGDIFDAKTDRDGILLMAVKKARSIEERKEESVPEPKKETLAKLATGGATATKIPTFLVGETPSEQTIVISKEKDAEHNVAKESNERVAEAEAAAEKDKEEKLKTAVEEAKKSAEKVSEEKEDTKETTTNIVVKPNASGRTRKN